MNGRQAVLIALLFVSSVALGDVTGTWSGSITGVCAPDSPIQPRSKPYAVTLDLIQSGNSVVGNLEAVGPTDPCTSQTSPTITVDFSLNGTFSGSTISGTATPSDGTTPNSFTLTVNGTSLDVNLGATEGAYSGTLTQTSSAAPSGALTGTWSGNYTGVFIPCGKLAPINTAGSITIDVVQVGNGVSGSVTVTGQKQDQEQPDGSCVVTDLGPDTIPFSGTVSGNTLTITTVEDDGKKTKTRTATVNGNTISGTFAGDFPGESTTFSVIRSSAAPPAPAVASFSATPSTISAGTSTTLRWSVANAASVSVDNGIGTQPASGSVVVKPAQTTTYTLTATGIGGTTTATTTVTVTAGTPNIVLASLPSGMIETPGGSAADSFTLTNTGVAPASVTLTQSGSFFTIAPASFTLNPGASQSVTIVANAQTVGTYDGTITIGGGLTFPVHLLVAPPPSAAVNPQPANPRSDVSALAGQNPSGSVAFTNNGAANVTAIAVADVPWIVPQSGPINIAPGQTANVSFNIDRSKRPDSSSLIGGVAGRISLVYLLPSAGKRSSVLGNTPSGSVSVTIVDVVKPNVAPGTPPALKSGEVALFIDGLRTANRFNGDLSVSSRPNAPSISDMQIFLTAAGAAQVSSIPALASGSAIAFPAINKNVFGVVGTAGGSLQVRSSQTPNIALSGVVSLNSGTPDISTATALPVFRSDRGIGAGQKMVLSGAQDSATAVWIQEVSGNAGHVSIQYLDANGATVGTDSGDLPAFAAAVSAAPDGTRSVVIANDSTTGGRFDAYAAINDPVTNDGWILTDALHHWGSASGPLIMPIVPSASNDVYVTNASSAAASVTLEVGSGMRRRAVKPSTGPSTQTVSVPPNGTTKTTLPAESGFVRISSASVVTASGRVALSSSGATFGSSLPAVPAGAALASGQGKRFTGVDDASAKSIGRKTAQTYRSTLLLVETSGQSATVRVTLTYTFVAGSTVSSQGVSSRDFTIGGNDMLTIGDLAAAIIGRQREAFGDLRNVQVDVDVIDGAGKVLPFVESIDNASGDMMVRAE